jgi:hypothetical protein
MADSDFAEALSGESEIQVMVVRPGDGRRRSLPVWFSVQGSKLELLPMYGLRTRWFRDLQASGKMEVKVKDESRTTVPRIILDPAAVDETKRRFGLKYGQGEVAKYYPTSEVALEISL